VRVEAGRLGDREQPALRSRPSEGGSVDAEDEGFEILAVVLPLSDGPGVLFALDRPPETAGLLGVPALCGDDGKLGRCKHCAPTVAEAQGKLEAAERVTFGGIEISALALEFGGGGELPALPQSPVNLVGDRGALKCEFDRPREIALSVGLLREVSEYLGLAARQAELAKCTE
jgi:hypothetical protein